MRANQLTFARHGANVSHYSDFVVDTVKRPVVETAGIKNGGTNWSWTNGWSSR